MKFVTIQNHRLAYREEGQGPVLLFVHGTPTSSFEYVELFHRLKPAFRCVAMDMLGFGESDKPKDGDYSLSGHTDRLRLFIRYLSLDEFHLVLHDFGGVIGLPVALEMKNKVRSLTLMNTWAWPLIETQPSLRFQQWLMKSRLMVWLYLRANFSARVLLKMSWGKYRPLTKEKHLAYQSFFKTAAERYGTVGFLKALFDFENPAWAIGGRLSELQSLPVRVIWGKADQLVALPNLERWKDLLPQAQVTEIETAGHYVADEAADLVAAAMKTLCL
ncbi:MAG: alpha/beta fold hydrolase [Deltaproteobacteria bacterium]|nr:alpha/beta fold hydrolase [Deltaproteobacteria bacterium]